MKDDQRIELQKIINKAQSAALSAEEKSSIRQSLLHTINTTPIKSPFWSFTYIKSYHYVPALVLAFIIFGGSTSYFAQNSLPGEALYSMKIGFNEKVESFFAVSPESLAEVDIKQANRRISEAETLAVSDKLTPEKNDEIQNDFSRKFDSANKKIAQLEVQGKLKSANSIKTKFDIELDSHEAVLQKLSEKSSTSPARGILSFLKNKRGRGGDEGISIMFSAAAQAKTSSTTIKSEDGGSEIHKSEDFDDDDESEDDDDDRSGGTTQTQNTTVTTPPAATTTVTSYTMVQVAVHNTKLSCYTVISGGVYDLTTWIAQHPGGQAAILGLCGIDGTSLFLAQHAGQTNPTNELIHLKIGVLK